MFLNQECSEEKKANFRKYLEQHGVIDAITEIFNKIIISKEKPENPIDFIRRELGDTPIPRETFESLELKIEEAHQEIRRLTKIAKELGLHEMLPGELENVGPSNAED